MSAYAALVSLLQTLRTILNLGGLRIIHNRAQLQSMHEKVAFLVDFLDKSSTCKKTSQISALETKMREAAHKAEDLIEFQISRRLDSDNRRLRNSMKITFREFLIFYLAAIYLRFRVDFSEMAPWIQTFLLYIFIISLAAAKCAVAIHLSLKVYDFHETKQVHRVLHDFNIIVKDVIQIKESRRDPEMSGYVALISLQQILDSNLDSGGRSSHNRDHLKSLHKKVSFLLDFLRNASASTSISTCMRNQELGHQILDAKIRDAARKAKSLIEFQMPKQFFVDSHTDTSGFLGLLKVSLIVSLPKFPLAAFYAISTLSLLNDHQLIMIFSSLPHPFWMQILVCFFILVSISFGHLVLFSIVSKVVFQVMRSPNINEMRENEELPQVINDFSTIVRNAIEIKDDSCGNPSHLPASRRDLGGSGKNDVVGLESDLEKIRDRLTREYSSKLELASIVGMGGIGKTTLARLVYNDPDCVYHFDARAWVTVSQEYSLHHVLLCLLNSANMFTKEMQEDGDDKLGVYLHKSLMGRRYLIIMDDVWDTQIWDSISIFFPENYNGSRVLMTSRLSNVASYIDSSSPIHKMRCLNEDDSWYLLCEKVFGGESCPLELESVGRDIARNCRGLPLAILVIGGLLYKDHHIKIWKDVAESLNSKLRQTEEQCLEILGLSYKHLPHHLRPCFLYMGGFPRDCEIHVSRLISLWGAEGFLKPSTSKNMEEMAEDYLKDLIDRNLILVCKRSCNGKIRSCGIHDLLRDVCVQNARRENFLHFVDWGGYVNGEKPVRTPRRLSIIDPDALQVNARQNWLSSYYYVRSLLCTDSKHIKDPYVVCLGFLYLHVLDVLEVHFGEFPDQIVKLVHLRYLAFHSDAPFPPSISNLKNLQTLVHHHCSICKHLFLPPVIWSMPNLRYINVKPGFCLSNPLGCALPKKSFVLEHLQTLVGIRNFKWTKSIIKKIPNVKKLRIWYEVIHSVDWSTIYQLESLVDLHQLETLKITIEYHDHPGSAIPHDPPKLAFPQKLKILTLSGCRIPWASMTMIGALPNLEALKLRREACSGPSWETVEGEFPQLIFLLLEEMHFTRWETEAAHFPRLQRLVIRSCGMLEEIPSAVGGIPTLEIIELDDCLPSAVDSAKEIREEQESMGNEELIIRLGLKSHIP